MPEWLIERGIGETRAALIERGQIIEARIQLEGAVGAGSVLKAVLKHARNPTIALAGGEEYLLPKGASGITEGASLLIEVVRERIPGAEPWKRPLARLSEASLATETELAGKELVFPAATDLLAAAGWSDLLEEARSGTLFFAGGQLLVSPTPAMTLIDVDGYLPPFELAMAGVRAAVAAIRRHGIGGSIGIDLPGVKGKDHRVALAEVVDSLLPQPFERTAVNGFGFLQIVRPRRHASLFELAQDQASFEARALLRQVAVGSVGGKRIVAHPSVTTVLQARTDWLERLERQIGGTIALRPDPALPMAGGYAEQA